MASAADRVPPEIWEQILLHSDLTVNDAFRLQGVSRSFNQTINGSRPLLRLMEIAHKPVEEKKHRIPNPVLWTSHLELRPFTYRIEVLAPASPKNKSARWNLNVHVALNMATEARVAGSPIHFGVRSNKRCFGDVLDGSWRRMKISRFPVVINVPMRIHYLDAYYEEKTTDVEGSMTLGDLAEMLAAVHARSVQQHRALADAFQNNKDREEEVRATDNQQCQVS